MERIDYGSLDRPDATTRIRLGSLAVSVSSSGQGASPPTVEVIYSRMERLYTTRAKHCVLACWNMMIPYLCPQLPEARVARQSGCEGSGNLGKNSGVAAAP